MAAQALKTYGALVPGNARSPTADAAIARSSVCSTRGPS
jgi:hypothetical protein